MNPFSRYPHGGRQLLQRLQGANARHEYGLWLQRNTAQENCAYCGLSLIDNYHHWLMLSVDHVVPAREAQRLGIPETYYQDAINIVLACSACNGFKNRYKCEHEPRSDWTIEAFVALRDAMFTERRAGILTRHDEERAFFERQPWSDSQ